MNKYKVSVNEPYLFGNEKKYLLQCLNDGFISSSGKFVKEFEKKFAKRVNRKFAITVSNGTAALQLAFEALNIKKNEEVILPSFTIISCILPIIRGGAIPVLIDSDPLTWNMDVNKVVADPIENDVIYFVGISIGLRKCIDIGTPSTISGVPSYTIGWKWSLYSVCFNAVLIDLFIITLRHGTL